MSIEIIKETEKGTKNSRNKSDQNILQDTKKVHCLEEHVNEFVCVCNCCKNFVT